MRDPFALSAGYDRLGGLNTAIHPGHVVHPFRQTDAWLLIYKPSTSITVVICLCYATDLWHLPGAVQTQVLLPPTRHPQSYRLGQPADRRKFVVVKVPHDVPGRFHVWKGTLHHLAAVARPQ